MQTLRKQRGITQEELAKAMQVSTQAVSKWECGGTPDAMLLPRLADYFNVSIDYLFGRGNRSRKD
ncbi:MAG: helix-turn-helix domain-containing protein [Clostridium sp.]